MADKDTTGKTTPDPGNVDAAAVQVQTAIDVETEQGFRGVETDKTPNAAYTVAGVVAGDPVPEAAADPVAARHEAGRSRD